MTNTETNTAEVSAFPKVASQGSIILDISEMQAMRNCLHELANVFTGVMIAGDLLLQQLDSESLRHYASHICEGSTRGGALVRELRSQMLSASGEAGAGTKDNPVTTSSVQSNGHQEIYKLNS